MKKNIYLLLLGAHSILCADLSPKVFYYVYTQATGKKSLSFSEPSLQATIDQAHARCIPAEQGTSHQAALDAALQKEISQPLPNVNTVTQLLRDGANPNAKNRNGESILIQSLAHKNPDQVTLAIITAGADIEVYRPEDTMSPLMLAIQNGNHELINELIEKQADPTIQTIPTKTTALMLAVQHCDIKTAEQLLKRTFNTYSHRARSTLNYQDAGGNTALIWAVKSLPQCRDQETMIRFLLLAGANQTITNNEGKTAVQLVDIGFTKARKLLEKYDITKAHKLPRIITTG